MTLLLTCTCTCIHMGNNYKEMLTQSTPKYVMLIKMMQLESCRESRLRQTMLCTKPQTGLMHSMLSHVHVCIARASTCGCS